jgi:hypothetical protein
MNLRNRPEKNSGEGSKRLIPLRKALMWIFLSVIIISGSSYAGFLYYRNLRDAQKRDPSFNIVAIAQGTLEPLRLSTTCLAELLDLSIDRPKNFFSFNTKEAEEKLIQVPVIRYASVKKIPPGIVHVDYDLRKPIALLADYGNTALDVEKVSFPVKPFFTPKKLPEIYLGLSEGEMEEGPRWGKELTGRKIDLAVFLLDLLSKNYAHSWINISSIDVSKAFSPSCGERQIVVVLEEFSEKKNTPSLQLKSFRRILRLGTENYEEQLENYQTLQRHLSAENHDRGLSGGEKDVSVIDLRLSNLAFIVEEP